METLDTLVDRIFLVVKDYTYEDTLAVRALIEPYYTRLVRLERFVLFLESLIDCTLEEIERRAKENHAG